MCFLKDCFFFYMNTSLFYDILLIKQILLIHKICWLSSFVSFILSGLNIKKYLIFLFLYSFKVQMFSFYSVLNSFGRLFFYLLSALNFRFNLRSCVVFLFFHFPLLINFTLFSFILSLFSFLLLFYLFYTEQLIILISTYSNIDHFLYHH